MARLRLLALAFALLLVGGRSIESSTASLSPKEGGLIVHEWGTFTAVSTENGPPLPWKPFLTPTDLPGFVYGAAGTLAQTGGALATKDSIIATVRMETPVLYFYADRSTNVSVKVDFPNGNVTEWYPQGRKLGSGIGWANLQVLPGAEPALPTEKTHSRYYAARGTDSAPIRASTPAGPEDEKFLFYRGVGSFTLPLSAATDHNELSLKAVGPPRISRAVLFENQNGKISYRFADSNGGDLRFGALSGDSIEGLRAELIQMLVADGLYQNEAAAMVETWGDSWFEEGLRAFYILPREMTDSIIPITIKPLPAEFVRVMVCRQEIITPEMEQAVYEQIQNLGSDSKDVRDSAANMLRQHGRFLEPILRDLSQRESDPTLMWERIGRLTTVTQSKPLR